MPATRPLDPPALDTPALDAPAYLRVDDFLRTEIEARALSFALARGVIAGIARGEGGSALDGLGLTPTGARLLLDLLRANGVVADGEDLALTPAFRAVLPFRDLLEAKLAFLAVAAADVHDHFPHLVADLPGFMARAGTFALFRYDLCEAATPEAVAAARRWVGYTTALTRHEAGPLLDAIGIEGHARLLDLGGNSGEFARQACRRAPGLAATVLDLPAVCAVGRDHLSGTPEAERVRFREGDLRREAPPGGHDLVTFKSVLHDWPDAQARMLLAHACAALPPGGRLVVAERAPFRVAGPPSYAMLANLVFFPFLRPADLYVEAMTRAGLVGVGVATLPLDVPFHIVSGRRP